MASSESSSPRLTRRAAVALGGTALGAGAAAFAGPPAPASAAPATSTNLIADVVVIGAGISGLVAARRLVQTGVSSLIVLEANPRVGGRTENVDLGNGVVNEAGGQWVGPGQDRVLALIKELGLSTFPTYVDGNSLYLRGGVRQTYTGTIPPLGVDALADFALLEQQLSSMAATVPAATPWAAPDAAAWDAMTFGQWLDGHSVSAESRWLLSLAMTLIVAEDPHSTSLLRIVHAIATSGGLEHMINAKGGAQDSRVVGGSQRISLEMTRLLGSKVILGSPVSKIDQSGASVVVQSLKARVTCKRVIVAMSPNDADRIDVVPALPVRRKVMQRRWHNGTQLKVFTVYDRPFWRDQGFSGQALTDLPTVNYCVDNSPPAGQVGVLMNFIGTAGADATLTWPDAVQNDPVARKKAVLADYVTLFGPKAASPINFVTKDWVHEPWIQGCISSTGPGLLTQYSTALTEPVGRIHWAGTEAAPESYSGYMEGAVVAGERAAASVRATL
jgi:monoamine oxidase